MQFQGICLSVAPNWLSCSCIFWFPTKMSLVSNSSVFSPQQNDCIDVNYILSHYRDWTTFMEVRASHSLVCLENMRFQVIYSTLYALIFVIGIIGNGLLISSIIRRKRATVSNIFLINLGIFDLVSCLVVVNTPSIASLHHHHHTHNSCL